MTAPPGSTGAPPVEPHVTIDAENPWPGLVAFGEGAAAFFHGRDEEAATLARLVGNAPLTVLFGKSGLGKTSLLQAGLFPRLRADGFFPVYLRLAVLERERPLVEQVAAALEREAARHGITVSPPAFDGTLWERLHLRTFALWSATNRPLVPLFVLDQFEEVFTLGASNLDAVERLRIDLADLVENRIPAEVLAHLERSAERAAAFDVRRQRYRVLLSFREDFLADVEGWRGDMPSRSCETASACAR